MNKCRSLNFGRKKYSYLMLTIFIELFLTKRSLRKEEKKSLQGDRESSILFLSITIK